MKGIYSLKHLPIWISSRLFPCSARANSKEVTSESCSWYLKMFFCYFLFLWYIYSLNSLLYFSHPYISEIILVHTLLHTHTYTYIIHIYTHVFICNRINVFQWKWKINILLTWKSDIFKGHTVLILHKKWDVAVWQSKF